MKLYSQNIHILHSRGEYEKKKSRTIFAWVMIDKFSYLMKNINLYIQESQLQVVKAQRDLNPKHHSQNVEKIRKYQQRDKQLIR